MDVWLATVLIEAKRPKQAEEIAQQVLETGMEIDSVTLLANRSSCSARCASSDPVGATQLLRAALARPIRPDARSTRSTRCASRRQASMPRRQCSEIVSNASSRPGPPCRSSARSSCSELGVSAPWPEPVERVARFARETGARCASRSSRRRPRRRWMRRTPSAAASRRSSSRSCSTATAGRRCPRPRRSPRRRARSPAPSGQSAARWRGRPRARGDRFRGGRRSAVPASGDRPRPHRPRLLRYDWVDRRRVASAPGLAPSVGARPAQRGSRRRVRRPRRIRFSSRCSPQRRSG